MHPAALQVRACVVRRQRYSQTQNCAEVYDDKLLPLVKPQLLALLQTLNGAPATPFDRDWMPAEALFITVMQVLWKDTE